MLCFLFVHSMDTYGVYVYYAKALLVKTIFQSVFIQPQMICCELGTCISAHKKGEKYKRLEYACIFSLKLNKKNNKNCISFKSREMKRITFGAAFHCVTTNLKVYFTKSTDIGILLCAGYCLLCRIYAYIHTYLFVCLFTEGRMSLSIFVGKHEREKAGREIEKIRKGQKQHFEANKMHDTSLMCPSSISNYTFA